MFNMFKNLHKSEESKSTHKKQTSKSIQVYMFKTHRSDKKCKLQTDSKDQYITHNVMYYGESPAGDFTCQKCQKSFAGKGLLSKHMKHSMCDIMKNYECEHCRKKYKKKESLDKHILLHFPRKKCNLCNLVLSRDKVLIEKNMNMHLQKIKLKKARSFKRKTMLQKRTREYLDKSGHYKSCPHRLIPSKCQR